MFFAFNKNDTTKENISLAKGEDFALIKDRESPALVKAGAQ